ncbi:type I polyketide synthase [Streptomyces radicis]|uniref:SDR family NAD(P)-dependent oxidoreductase n=1 Tax=Streptomyces radicis TaxID=1750517 RepID=A0A3A9X0B9_9ACTN|nr:type I polyketide synthase [Streptomyces radicis]RKN11897.1 SDR family NAD(P)-dependent oxidoreductase [Streptomyces radicis]RKN26053.1 SDR family NAD(P)-dependent oxidoreductase [Streptomyces radicis]
MSTSYTEVIEALRASLQENEQLRRQNEELVAMAREPIAVVSMSCRYPGGIDSPEALWRFIADEGDAVAGFPENRGWDLGTDYTREAAFLADADQFDAGFFAISPREALAMDPQQRLLLEVAWETVERARIVPSALKNGLTGVYMGSTAPMYGHDRSGDAEGQDGHLLTGSSAFAIAGRVSYTFGLQGPSVTIDTACSSSLVAIHQAVQALRAGECTLALAGGTAIVATPEMFLGFEAHDVLSFSGRCRAFAAAADGIAFSEGVGVLLLERLSDARRNGHPVLAVIRGTSVNQDGASNGMTAPNGPAQAKVIQQALANARLTAEQVDAVEAHGTGTTLGDPIEAHALMATYGRRPDDGPPLWLGSVKSNLGHSMAAAGVAGVIKMVMAMRHGVLPKTLHVDEPSPHIDWSAGHVDLLTEARPWPELGRPRRSAVSSFGISGTNAHLILEEPPTPASAAAGERAPDDHAAGPLPFVLAARTPAALRDQAARLLAHVEERPELPLADVALSLATTRTAFTEQRAAVVAEGRDALLAGLRSLADGAAPPEGAAVATGAVTAEGKTVFVFPGQGAQWAGMAVRLLTSSPAFADRFAEAAAAVEAHTDWSVEEVLRGAEGAPDLQRVDVVQPTLFVVMVALAELWRVQGVVPDAVVGHSQGEIAAAVVAGALTLADGARIVALRSQVIRDRLAGQGGMASLAQSRDETLARIEPWADRLAVAAANGGNSTVVAGDPAALDALTAACEADGVRIRRIPVDYASHSPQVDSIRDELLGLLADIAPTASAIPFHSTVDTADTADGAEGGPIDTTGLDAAYWTRNLRETVEFEGAVRGLRAAGHTLFVEISPHPVLTMAVEETTDTAVATVGTLRRDQGGADRFLTSLAEAWTRGAPVDWIGVLDAAGAEARPADLPTYAFQRRGYWLKPAAPAAEARRAEAGDATDAAFWEAVENGDLGAFTEGPALDDSRPLRDLLPALAAWRRASRDRAALDSWRHTVAWKPLATAAPARPTGSWLVVVPTGGDAEAIAAVTGALRGDGTDTVVLDLDPTAVERATLAATLADLAGSATDFAGVVSLLALGGDGALAATMTLTQALSDAGLTARLWCVTRGAVAVGAADPPADPEGAELWGLGRVAALEYPFLWGGLVDLPATPDERSPARLATVLAGIGDEDQVAVRASGAYGRRLVPAPLADRAPTHDWRPSGTVLITGGTGRLGAGLARWAAAQGAEHVLLTGRRGAEAPGAAELAAEIEESGTRVTVAACDVADREQLAALLAGVPDDAPLTAVIHAAGSTEGLVFDAMTPDDLERIRAAKVYGAQHLDALLADRDLAAFVLFSSHTGVLGGGHQGAYSAANARLAALAERRRARGLRATCVAWGVWGGEGIAYDEAFTAHMRRRGVLEMDPRVANEAMAQAVRHDETSVAVTRVDWPLFAASFTAERPSPLLSDLPAIRRAEAEAAERPAPEPESGEAPSALVSRLTGASPAGQESILIDLVAAEAAAVLGHTSPEEIGPHRLFRDLGFDSLTITDLRRRLAEATGLALPASLVFDHPNPASLAAFLRGELLGGPHGADAASPAAERAPAAVTPEDDPVVIVGMSCRLAGGVESPEQFWDALVEGRDLVGPPPADRGWDNLPDDEDDLPMGNAVRRIHEAGLIGGITEFDPAFFGISPDEAVVMDPQQRILLEVAWEAFERAGIDPRALADEEVGVYTGIGYQGFVPSRVPEASEPYLGASGAPAFASGRLAYALDLNGPTVTIDTGCSSSAVSLHLATQAVLRGECSVALAGGIAVLAQPFAWHQLTGGSAADGRCKPYDDNADGPGWGEGASMVAVERLSRARRLGHPVLAVIRGSAINHKGTSNGLTAPNAKSQQQLIQRVLAEAGLTGDQIHAVEGHGTGTQLGDAVEVEALQATYGRGRPADGPLRLSTAKSHIGHPQNASGVVGVIKTILSMRHGLLPAMLHTSTPVSQVDWSQGTVRLVTEHEPWERGAAPRRAGVSSFGASGTQVHLILEEPPGEPPFGAGPSGEPVAAAHAGDTLPFPLSARSAAGLRAQAGRLREHLAAHPELAQADIAHSLATGRATFEHRALITAADRAELLDALAVLEGEWERDEPAAHVLTCPEPSTGRVRTALLFTGAPGGSTDALYKAFPPFAEAWDTVRAHLDVRLPAPTPQADAFAREVALTRLYESWGAEAEEYLFHGAGALAAAHAAGRLSLEDAAALLAAAHAGPDGAEPELRAALARVTFTGGRPLREAGTGEAVGAERLTDPAHWLARPEAPTSQAPGTITLTATTVAAALAALAAPYVRGASADWGAVLAGTGARRVDLPTYAFQRGRYWLGEITPPYDGRDYLHLAAFPSEVTRRKLMLDEQKRKDIVLHYFETLNAGKLDDIVALFSDDAVVQDPVGHDPHSGPAAVRKYYENVLAHDLTVHEVGDPSAAMDGKQIAIPAAATSLNPLEPRSGARVEVRALDVFSVNAEGLIESLQVFWGLSDMRPVKD